MNIYKNKNYLLVIAIDNYSNGFKKNEIIELAKQLPQRLLEKYDFEQGNIKILVNEQVTKNAIIEILFYLIKTTSKDDNLIIYLALHCKILNKQYYWIPFNAKPEDYHLLIHQSEFFSYFDAVKAKNVLFLADSSVSPKFYSSRKSDKKSDTARLAIVSNRKSNPLKGDKSMIHQVLSILENNNFDLNLSNISLPLRRLKKDKGGDFIVPISAAIAQKQWEMAQRRHTVDGYQYFVSNYQSSQYVNNAKEELSYLKIRKQSNIQVCNDFLKAGFSSKYIEEVEWIKTVIINEKKEYKSFKQKYPVGKYYKQVQEQIDYFNIKENATLQLLNNFIQKYPHSKHIEEVEWIKTRNEGTRQQYENFIQKYPNGKYKKQAQEEVDYFNIKENAALQLLNNFIQKYPHSKYIEEVEWIKTWNEGTKQQYENFIQKYPNGKYKKQAQEEVDYFNIKENAALQLLNNFIQKYPHSKYIEEVEWIKTWNEGTKQQYENFIQKYPNGKYKKQAQEEVDYFNIKENTTLQLLNNFIQEYPNSTYLEEIYWKKTLKEGNKEAFELFINKYPNSQYHEEARREYNKKYYHYRWTEACKKNTIEGYRDFLMLYPNSEKKHQVEEKIDYLRIFRYKKMSDKIDASKSFLTKYPDSVYLGKVKSVIDKIREAIQEKRDSNNK